MQFLSSGAYSCNSRLTSGPEPFFDCHLMIENPTKWAAEFKKAGASSITMHVEALGDQVNEAIAHVRELGLKVGLALKPNTPAEALLPYLDKIDLALGTIVEAKIVIRIVRAHRSTVTEH